MFSYFPCDYVTGPNPNRRETEREYFMRMAREQRAVAALEKRQATKHKVKAALRSVANQFKPRRTESLEALLGR